jgi:hypothetical protein
VFEEYGLPGFKTVNGIAEIGGEKGALGEITRALFLKVVLEDRDAALVAARLEALEDHRGGCLGIVFEQLGDVELEGIEKRAPGATLVGRWVGQTQESIDGVARHPEASGDRGLGTTLSFVEPMDFEFSTGEKCSVFTRRRH